ncbi:MAG: serine/threonine-protein kinase [Desulfomonilaceae bacterium]|jgi:serine/threonine protein kinase
MAKCDSLPNRFVRSSDNKFSIQVNPSSLSIVDLSVAQIKDIATAALYEHNRQVRSGSVNVKKDAPETSVSIVSLPDAPVLCVKHFKNRGTGYTIKGIFRATHGVRAFQGGENLFRLGFTLAPPIALIRNMRFGISFEEWLVMPILPEAEELDRYMVKRIRKGWPKEEKLDFLNYFANFLAHLHSSGVFHTDLKTCNIMVFEDSNQKQAANSGARGVRRIGFSLLDYDDVRVCKGAVGCKIRAKNLSQLFLSTPSAIDLDDRMEFFNQYFSSCYRLNIDKKRLLEMMFARIDGKTLLYVGPEGDISENWTIINKGKECVDNFL